MIGWGGRSNAVVRMSRNGGDSGQHGRYLTGAPGGPDRAAALRLAEAFLHDLQADWEQHGKDILEVMRLKHPEIYFQCMVKLALVQAAELDQPRPFERQYTPEEVIARLEQRVGPEGRRLFENFLRKVKRLERRSQQGAAATPSMHIDAVDDEGEE
jgi:hypothetical protein